MALSQAREKQLKKEKFLLKQAQVIRVPVFPVVQLQHLIRFCYVFYCSSVVFVNFNYK